MHHLYFSLSAKFFSWYFIMTPAIILSLATFQNASGQATGKIAGYVTDAKTGEPLIGVTVKIEGTNRGSATAPNGYYVIENMPAQTYSVTASYVGYESQTKFNVVVRSGVTQSINFTLEEKSSELDEIVVQASPFGKQAETPNSIQRLNREEIGTYPGGNNDIAKVVQSLPGVSGSVGFRNDVIIRGGAPNENVYFLDGIEIPNINHFATQGSAGGPVGMLNVSFIDNVSLKTSSFPAKYNNALSGILQFDQRNGNPQNRQTNLRVGASEAALTFEGPFVKPTNKDSTANTTFIASVRRSYLQLLFQLIDLPFLPDYWDYQYKIHHHINKKNEINLIGLGSIDNFEINRPEDASLEQEAILDQIPVIQQWTSTIGISWKHKLENGFFDLALSSNILNNTFERYRNSEIQENLLFSNQSVEDENQLRFDMTQFLDDWTISGGINARYSRYENATLITQQNLNYATNTNFYNFGAYSQVTKPFLGGRLEPSFGFRVDGNTFMNDGMNLLETFSPRAALSYRLSGKWTANVSWGQYFKIPPYTILGYKNNEGRYANKDSEYIQSTHYVAGLEYLPRRSTRFTLEGFYKKYENYPVSLRDSVSLANLGGDFEVLGNENIVSTGLGRAYGLEFLFQQKLKNKFYGILAYTLYWSEFTGINSEEYLPSLWDNRHLITFTGGYKLPRNWEIGARVRFLGGSPYAPVDRNATENRYPTIVKNYQQLGNQRLEPYNAADIRIDKKWNFKNWSLDLYLEATNVLAKDLPNDPTYTLERNPDNTIKQPKNLIKVEDTDNSSVIPTIGLVVDF